MALKSEKLKIYLFREGKEHFKSQKIDHLLHFVQKNPVRCQFKDKGTKYMLEINSVYTVYEALTVLLAIQEGVEKADKSHILTNNNTT